jgi:hypothetical protein
LKQLFHAEGIADAVDFKLSPGIRGPEHTHAGYSCVDEQGCDAETYYLCAHASAQSNTTQVDFLACQDAASGSAATVAQNCATQTKIDWQSVSTCFGGDQGQALKKGAADYFDKRFPQPVGVPHIEINGNMQSTRTYAALLKVLCATGIKAGACSQSTIVV